jgi:hypothetical protein
VVVSKWLGFAHCRYNGKIIAAPFVQMMREQLIEGNRPIVEYRRKRQELLEQAGQEGEPE